MKPDEEMHAAVEEVDLDPCDLYTDLGTLIVEGRLPGITERGFGEGLHCPTSHGQNRHQCDPSSPECQKYEQIFKHMLLLWKNGIPMTIEVLLYPSCCTPFQNVDSVPEMSYLLLEQWTIHMLPRRVPDASITSRGLIQAVRSFLYFSQLCSWYMLTGGKSPQNVHYRVCVPGEAFSSKFSSPPDCHIFPTANVGKNSAMKVLMKCLPRCGEIPTVPCHIHSQPTLPLKALKGIAESDRKDPHSFGDYVYDGILPTGMSSRTSSPADSMLGDSLLDPPNSLCMYPKRYQSPSRCGSPSIEVPEHLMFGKGSKKREDRSPPRRSRPQRRPVVERFLKKNFEDDLDSANTSTRTYEKRRLGVPMESSKSEVLGFKNDSLQNFCCIDECLKQVPRDEMEQVLERLRERHSGVKCSHRNSRNTWGDISQGKNVHNKSLSSYVQELTIGTNNLEHSLDNKKNVFLKSNEPKDSKNLFRQALRLNKESSNNRRMADKSTKSISSENYQSVSEFQNLNFKRNCTPYNVKDNPLLVNKLNILQSDKYPESFKPESSNHVPVKSDLSSHNLFHNSGKETQKAYQNVSDCFHKANIPSKQSSVNIKKCGAFMGKNCDHELSDERNICDAAGHSSCFEKDESFEDATSKSYIIPSAEKKALFRQSLDSATTLVFHQRNGLPLTSSPAPIRKSGTCFDFDSSLTSVSAIKRALFEKDSEEIVEREKILHLSNSAPASIFSSSLLGTFEESVLNGRLEPVSTVEGFTAEIGASGSFCPRHITLPVTVFFYTLQDMDKVTSPYLGHVDLRKKDYHIPKKGTVQVTLFNPHQTVVKMFVVRYDLSDMPNNCQTFLRQRTLYMPSDASESDTDAQKWLRYLIHLRFMSSKSGRIYLHTDVRVIIFRKSDLDAATVHGQRPYELRSFIHGPVNPKFSSHKP